MSTFQFRDFVVHQAKSAMKVNTDAMILGSLIESKGKTKGLDIGTGTGVLSLMIAQRNTQIEIEAIEIDQESAEDAIINFNNSNWANRLKVNQIDFLDFQSLHLFDLIVSNPPYFENGILNSSSRKAKTRHEESLPLIQLLEKSAELLSANGDFWIILPFETALKWKEKATSFQLFCTKEIIIFSKENQPKRIVYCFSKMNIDTQFSSITIRNEDNTYSEEYKKLTIDFHGKII